MRNQVNRKASPPPQNALDQAEKAVHKHHGLLRGTPSITRSIADALVIKSDNLFFLCQPNGDVPLTSNHGYGLYYHDCRYLNGYEIRMADSTPTVLVSTARSGYSAIIELTNPEIVTEDGMHIPRDVVGVRWERVLEANQNRLCDCLTLQNYSLRAVTLPISLVFRSRFEDIFFIRGLLRQQPGELRAPRWENGTLVFEYAGKDSLIRCLTVQFSPPAEHTDEPGAMYSVHLDPRESRDILLTLTVHEMPAPVMLSPQPATRESALAAGKEFQQNTSQWQAGQTTILARERITRDLLERALTDLRTLRSSFGTDSYYAAGVPWFTTLFGRDSLLSSLQMLAINPEIAVETLRLLARYQAHETSAWQDAQPGKILHELRDGEFAHLGAIPQTPYYGSIDATPLFLLLLARTSNWLGSLDVFHELHPNIEAALEWIDRYGDSDGDGYVDYQSHSDHGLINQGWKDSGTSIVNADGSLAAAPIALAEVQGYVYRAKLGIACLYQLDGDAPRAARLREEAAALRQRFNRDFWSERLGAYVLALQAGGKPAEVIASNAGQVLWSGIADPEKAQVTVKRLMEADMFNGWGIRTLSSADRSYNPTGYHLGTVWPFDTGLIAAGFRRYGADREAGELSQALVEAALGFDVYRLPELFAGFSRADYGVPVHYPVACHPQAWSAGCIPYLLTSLLGLAPDGFHQRLNIVRPLLPDLIGEITLQGLRVGNAKVDLTFSPAQGGGPAIVAVREVSGDLKVEIETERGDFDF
jgi:glycogen debranching enzyme